MRAGRRKKRARELGLDFGGSPGPANAITDVPGVLVGYRTIIEGDGALAPGKGPVRTGVTAILPRGSAREMMPVWAGFHALNGNGEMTGVHWINHAGHFYGPICLTNTHGVGAVHHGVTGWMIETYADEFAEDHVWALPVVAETYDGVLNDINGRHVREAHVREAIAAARAGLIAEGNVGGGTGMICYEFKGGTGTASQQLEIAGREYSLGVLVQANHGRRDWLTILGAPVGRHLREDRLFDGEQGSIIVVIGTDIPMLPHQLARLAQRASIGIGRHGTPGGNNSGDIFLAFSTANPTTRRDVAKGIRSMECIADELFDPVYLAAVRATEEAVVNALLAAEDMTTLRPAGRICRAIDAGQLLGVLRSYGRAGHE